MDEIATLLIIAAAGLTLYTVFKNNNNHHQEQHVESGRKKEKKGEYSGKGGYLGTPGFYTKKGHHHCKQGSSSDCICTDAHKCTKGSHYAAEMTDLYGSYLGYARVVGSGGSHITRTGGVGSGGSGRRMIDHTLYGGRLSHH